MSLVDNHERVFGAPIEPPESTYRLTYDPFDHHVVSEDCRHRLATTRRVFKTVRDYVLTTVPPCRERSLALTELQQALSYSIQALVFTHPDSVPETDEPVAVGNDHDPAPTIG